MRDLLDQQRRSWRNTLEQQLRHSSDAGELTLSDPATVAFAIDAILQATNIELRLGNDTSPDRARAAVDELLAGAA